MTRCRNLSSWQISIGLDTVCLFSHFVSTTFQMLTLLPFQMAGLRCSSKPHLHMRITTKTDPAVLLCEHHHNNHHHCISGVQRDFQNQNPQMVSITVGVVGIFFN